MTNYADTQAQRRRLQIMAAGLGVLALILIGRLVSLQIFSHEQYLVMASREQSRRFEIPAVRGQIYMLDGETKVPAALNQGLKLLYADPSMVTDKVKTARTLAELTGDDEKRFYTLLNQKNEYVVLKNKVANEVGDKIAALRLPGVGLSNRQYRTYPEGSLAAQILGFVNNDGEGQYGVEGYLNAELSGTPGLLSAKTDTRGNLIATADNVVNPAVNGRSYVLTIDRSIQAQAEKYLKEGVENVNAASGSVVIMDPHTGAIKAMANYPTYDPNNYAANRDYSVFSNSVIANQFEPGSGFKVITMAAGLNTGRVRPETTYNDTGMVEQDDRQIRNADNHKFGVQNMVDVIQKSLNTGVIFVLKSLGGDQQKINTNGKKVFYDYITKHFGFGVPTGIEQAGEAAGSVNTPTKGTNVNYANMTFGQGISVTMIQMVTAFSAIANGGELYQPRLIDQVIEPDGTVSKQEPKLVKSDVVSDRTARELGVMLTAVVDKGSGYATRIRGYKVGGKTGTAQIPRADGQGYEENKNIGSFIGYAPIDNPRFVMMVRINEPKVRGFAESTTVPVFANIAKWLLNYYAVPPDSQ